MSLARDEASRESYFAAREKFYERKVAGIYRSALDDIRKEMSAIYERYAINGILSRADMTRYNRLATLEKNILQIMTPAVRASLKEIDRLRPAEYGEAFFRTAWAVDNATGVGLTWGPLNTKAITAELDSSPFYAAGKERTLITIPVEVTTAINNGLAMGQSYTEMMRDLKGLVNKKAFETMRILRTELHTAQELGTSAAYDEALEQGVKGKVVWVATLDGRTRDSHAAMDGVAKDDDGLFHGEITAEYPGDPALDASERINCRCTMIFELEGFEPTIRRSREDGIIPYQTYSEWKEDRKLYK